MGIEKEGSKGGYVGGFFQLFDWKAKSKKKLFSSKSDIPEHSKQGKRSDENLATTRFRMMEDDDNGPRLNIRGYNDYSCASSVTDDEGYGAKAPGVVARLMGLDSMPTSSYSDASSSPVFDTQSLREVSQRRRHFDYYRDDPMMHCESLLGKQDGPSLNFVESKPRKVLSRPIEKFQTEILPPKSAKSIPLTHHKLLSPIKSPGFIPSKTAAHIMEAAAKIIESSPQHVPKAKMPSVGSSSVPLKVRDLKEKLENAQKVPLAASSSSPFRVRDVKVPLELASRTSRNAETSRRPNESHAANQLKGQMFHKSWNGPAEPTASFRPYTETEEGYFGSKGNGRSISLAVQAKVNVQRREGLNLSSSGGLIEHREAAGEMPAQTFKSQPNPQKRLHNKHIQSNSSGVLRPNHQKQNSIMDREKLSLKPSHSNLQSRKTPSRQKSSNKTVGPRIGSRKMALEVADGEKDSSPYSMRNAPRKKRLIDGSVPLGKSQPADNMLIGISQRATESSPVADRTFGWAEESKRKGVDVVSFTFTAPLARSGSETPGRTPYRNFCSSAESRGKRLLLDAESMKLSSVGYNLIGGDALSDLLEQKLKELSSSIASSHNRGIAGPAASSTSFLEESMHVPRETSRVLNPNHRNNESLHQADRLGESSDSGLFSSGKTEFRWGTRFQGTDPMDECNSKNSDSRRPSPNSVLDNPFSAASSSSFESNDSAWPEGSKLCSSIQAPDSFGFSSSKRFHYVDAEMDLSDSASSTTYTAATRKHAIPFCVSEPARSINWEVEYVAKILSNLELMFQDFALGRTSEIINLRLFDQLEGRKHGSATSSKVEGMLERKAIFDSVAECLDVRCRRYVGGGCKSWVAGVTMVRRKEWLAEEVHREISAWRGMGHCNVDELVDKDMSTQHGKWLDFEVDEFTLGAEVEAQIFDSLVDEMVADLL